MGNCCASPGSDTKTKASRPNTKNNPFYSEAYTTTNSSGTGFKLSVLKDPTGHDISLMYDLGREVGRGEFGITYLCTDIKTGEKYACKSISKKKLRTAVDIEDVRREVEIMKHMPKHPNIVTLKDAFEDDDAVHIVMELCEGGELFDRIVARGHYTERAAAAVMKTILEVVQICHKNGVMHRDLKPENFLFANKKENSPLKAIDFGLSVFFKPGEGFNEIVGSPYYMAPEVLRRHYGPEVDIWSAGVILYILLCGVPPFWAETEQGVAQAIIRSVIDFKRDPWPRVSDTAKDLVRRMLEPDPKKRLSAAEVLEHPWIQNAKKAPNVFHTPSSFPLRLYSKKARPHSSKMIMSEENRREICKYLFKEGVLFAKKDFNLAKHPLIESVPNLQVIKLMQSFKSKEYVRETFAWMHYYWFLTNEGIEFLRTYLNLPSDVVPATLKKSAKPIGRPFGGGPPGDRPRGPRFEGGDRPRYGDRDGYRRGGEGEKGGAPADYQPSFQGSGGRPGFGRGAGGYSAAAPSGSGLP